MLIGRTTACRHLATALVGVGIVHVGLVDVLEVLQRTVEIHARILHGALSEHGVNGVLAELVVPCYHVLYLPYRAAIARLVSVGDGGAVVAREIIERCVSVCTPERKVGTIADTVSQSVADIEVAGEVSHELMAPVLVARQ